MVARVAQGGGPMSTLRKDVPLSGARRSLAVAAPAVAPRPAAAPMPVVPPPAEPDEAQLRQWQQAAEQRGYEAGYERGLAEANRRLEQELEQLARLAESMQRAHADRNGALQAFAAEFALAVTVRLLAAAAPTREGVLALAASALAQVPPGAALKLRVHARDAQLLQQFVLPRVQGSGGEPIEVIADASVELGGCLVDTPTGTLDARLESQLQALKQGLLAACGESAGEGG